MNLCPPGSSFNARRGDELQENGTISKRSGGNCLGAPGGGPMRPRRGKAPRIGPQSQLRTISIQWFLIHSPSIDPAISN